MTFAELRGARDDHLAPPRRERLFEDPNDQGFWAVVAYADLVEVTKRHDDFLSGEGIVFESSRRSCSTPRRAFIAMDPPRHTKVRRLLSSAFTPKQMAPHQRPHRGQRPHGSSTTIATAKGEVDFVAEVAALVPMHNICDMVGIPDERPRRTLAHEAQFAGGWRDPDLCRAPTR